MFTPPSAIHLRSQRRQGLLHRACHQARCVPRVLPSWSTILAIAPWGLLALLVPGATRWAEGEVDTGSHRIRRFLTRSPPPHTPYTCRHPGDEPHPDRHVPGGLRVLRGPVFVKNRVSASPAGRPARPQLGTAPGTGLARGGCGYLRVALETNAHSQLGDSQPEQNLRIGCPMETQK